MKRNNTYNLPAEIAIALQTNRPELLGTMNRALNKAESKEVLRLIGDLISDRVEDRNKIDLLQDTVTSMVDRVEKLAASVHRQVSGIDETVQTLPQFVITYLKNRKED